MRIPKEPHRRLRFHCVESDMTLRDFVIAALRERLAKTRGRSESL
jgi:hypothetical protein